LYGTEIHNILQACFTYTNENKPDKSHDLWLDLLTGPNANCHLVNFEKNLRKNTNSGITDLTSHERVLETIEYAKKLREAM
jgi:hypothetical protein